MYEFIDTTEYSTGSRLPSEALSVNGVYLENEVSGYRTLQVTGREIMEAEVANTQVGNRDGADYQYKRIPPREITVTFFLSSGSPEDFRDKFNTINGILSQEEAMLIFYDEPDKYFTGTLESVEIPDGGLLDVIGAFTFLCSNPRKHSTVTKTFTATENDDGILEMTIKNEGSVSVPISYEITHNAENGFIGIVSEYGAIQLGKVDEIDGYTYETSKTLTTSSSVYKWSEDSNWADDTGTNALDSDYQTAGTFETVTDDDGYTVLGLGDKGSSVTQKWNGAMKTFDVGDYAATSFYCYVNSWFETSRACQTGLQSIAFLDEDNNMICAQEIIKSNSFSNTATANFYVGGTYPRKVKSVTFTPSSADSDNPYNQARGHSDMKKEGAKITFYWWGTYPSVSIPSLENVKVAKVQIYMAQYAVRTLADTVYMAHNYFRKIMLQALNAERWNDISNRYQGGDVIAIDGETRKVYVNDMIKAGDEMVGSTYFNAPPGETTVQFLYSDWCSEAPTATATIREAYL